MTWATLRAGDLVPAGPGFASILPDADFETYSEAGYRWDPALNKWQSLEGIRNTERGLGVVGTRNYVQHPSFRVLCFSYNLKDGNGAHFWRPGMAPPQDLFDHLARGGILEAWNVEFERTVWEYHCVPVLGWPPFDYDNQLRCCMAKAAAWSLPRALDNTGKVLKLTQQKDEAGKALIRKLTVPRNPTKANPALQWTPQTAADDFLRFYAYNVQDIMTEGEASARIPDLCSRELEIWKVDQRINQRGMPIDRKAVGDCIAIVEQCTAKYSAELASITGSQVLKHTDVQGTLKWLAGAGVYLPNLDEDTVEEQLNKPHDWGVLRVLKIRQVLSFGSVKKLYAMRVQTCADGRLRGQYAYHAAHTSLWNGQGVQVANLYKGKLDKPEKVEAALSVIASRSLEYVEGVYGDALECVADCLRSMIVASPGHRLIAADFNAIQAVVTSALAGEEWRLEVFRTHGKIYEAMASRITGKSIEYYMQYRRENNKHHDDRQLGKLATLSADFGAWIAGWKRFGAEKYGDDEFLKQLILKTRAAQPMIVELWGGQVRNKFRWNEQPELYGLEGAAISAVLNPGTCYAYRGIRYLVHNDVLYCQPPGNGAPLVYHEPRLEPSTREYARPWELDLTYMGWNSNATKGAAGWVRMPLYGGVLTQNTVAKVSREYQADGLVRCDRSGIYLPVMHTHDEIVSEVPLGVGTAAEFLGLINVPREGCYDDQGRPWPVRAPTADETPRYGKWE